MVGGPWAGVPPAHAHDGAGRDWRADVGGRRIVVADDVVCVEGYRVEGAAALACGILHSVSITLQILVLCS